MDDDLKQYRSDLIEAEKQAQEDYDKTILTLSSGALGISIAFIKNIVGEGPIVAPGFLYWAWICWGASMASILVSFYTSHLALRREIRNLSEGKTIEDTPGGIFDKITAILNPLSGVLLIVGIILIALFVANNLEM